MTIATENIDIVARILRDQIYSDKIMAVIREYSCNAIDEHIKYKIERPVELVLNKDDKSLTIRDFGLGLSKDFVFNIYGMIGKSMKGEDEDLIGGYGLGSKSGHAYGDQFTITSFYGGKKSVYLAALENGESGVSVGMINEITTLDSDEPTGVEINIPIKQHEINSFQEKINQFVRGVQSPITVNGETVEGYSKYGGTEHLEHSCEVVRVGHVLYKIPFQTKLKSNNINITLDIPLNSVSIPPSRELIDDTAGNRKILNDAIEKMFDEVEVDFRKAIDDMKINEAIKLASSKRLYKYLTQTRSITKDGIKISEVSLFGTIFDQMVEFYQWRDSTNIVKCVEKTRGRMHPVFKFVKLMYADCKHFVIANKPCGRAMALMLEDTYSEDIIGSPKENFFVIYDCDENKDAVNFIRKHLECTELTDEDYELMKTYRNTNRGGGGGRIGKIEDEDLVEMWSSGGGIATYAYPAKNLIKKDPIYYCNWGDYKSPRLLNYFKLTKSQFKMLQDDGYTLIHYHIMDDHIKSEGLKRVKKSTRYEYAKQWFRTYNSSIVKVIDKHFDKKLAKVIVNQAHFDILKVIKFSETDEFKILIDKFETMIYSKVPKWKILPIVRLDCIYYNDQGQYNQAIEIIKKAQ